MQMIDISRDISNRMTLWPGDPPVSVQPLLTMDQDGVRVSRLALGTHTGTHVDPPAHFLPGGATVDQIALEALIGPAWVVDLRPASGVIQADDLNSLTIPAGIERLLLRTASGPEQPGKPFQSDYIALSPGAADWMIERGIRLVGIDTLSIETFAGDGSVHRKLLGAEIVVLEGLVLSAAAHGQSYLICLPLKILAGDGAPARAVLIQAVS